MSLSVLTLVRGRQRQFANLVAGLCAQTRSPDELVVAAMGMVPDVDAPFPIRTITVPGERLPLAAARNATVRAAAGEGLVFLDVDCIPAPSLVARYADCLVEADGCFIGEVRYLPFVPEPPLDLGHLEVAGVRHPSKPEPPADGAVLPEPDHGELWGLSFALRRDTFARAGGFDERYAGYGGEETDFARALAAAGVPLYRVGGALAFHQHHAVHVPPLQHFDDIIRNATLFHAKWGSWPMDYWLGQFAAAGYVEWAPEADTLTAVRWPTRDEIAAARAPEGTLFS